MVKRKDYHGVVVNGMTFVKRTGNKLGKDIAWLVRCHCGNEFEARSYNVLSGNTRSCGCSYGTHKATGTPLYGVWKNMKARCSNPNIPSYHRYGGRGITVCKEWEEDFSVFRSWAEQEGYYKHSKKLSIDRIDNDKGYSPDNCRWTTKLTQSRNRSPSSGSKSGVRGVNWSDRDRRWYARIMSGGTSAYLGSFKDVDSAIKARMEAEIELWGYTNIKETDFHNQKIN